MIKSDELVNKAFAKWKRPLVLSQPEFEPGSSAYITNTDVLLKWKKISYVGLVYPGLSPG